MPDSLDERLAGLAGRAERASAPPPVAAIRGRARRRSAATGLVATALVVAAAGAGVALATRPSPHPAPPPPAASAGPTPDATPSASAAGPPSTVSSPPSTPGAADSGTGTGPGVVACRTATGLRTTAGTDGATSGHHSLMLMFVNAGTSPCRMRGYPGVDALNAAGAPVVQAKRTLSGYLGGPGAVTTIVIPVGHSAAAMVEADVMGPNGDECTAGYAALLVTPPDDTASTRLPWTTESCAGLQIHPVILT
ncbi:DUF4232 domain-containing protein [Dactylosporangium sp. McL0621]|uniref:DUF4232 domain-containing protein n=1 Tax=Dactylosporangium sp. McL0621 TaxID=3415678 RepID=UPI003CEBD0F1